MIHGIEPEVLHRQILAFSQQLLAETSQLPDHEGTRQLADMAQRLQQEVPRAFSLLDQERDAIAQLREQRDQWERECIARLAAMSERVKATSPKTVTPPAEVLDAARWMPVWAELVSEEVDNSAPLPEWTRELPDWALTESLQLSLDSVVFSQGDESFLSERSSDKPQEGSLPEERTLPQATHPAVTAGSQTKSGEEPDHASSLRWSSWLTNSQSVMPTEEAEGAGAATPRVENETKPKSPSEAGNGWASLFASRKEPPQKSGA